MRTEAKNSKVLLNIREAASFLGLSEKGMWGIVYRRDIESIKVGRLRKISTAALRRFLKENTTTAKA